MRADMFARLSDCALLGRGPELVKQQRTMDATFLAWIAEVDARKLYLPAGYPSMFSYCVHVLNQTEDVALKYIRASRVARQFPEIFEALAAGRMNLSGVIVLKSHLTRENVEELLKAAQLKTRAEIELLLAERFPRSEVLPLVCALPNAQVAPGPPRGVAEIASEHVRETREQVAPGPPAAHIARSKVVPLSGRSYELRFCIGQRAHEKLIEAQELLSHRVSAGDLAELFERGLDVIITQAERRKYAATDRPQRARRSTSSRRHIPAAVKRAVRERDGRRCTFVSADGNRCPARTLLEFDHCDEVARGGRSTVDNVRLRCRSHNQFTAERTFGAGFMANQREEARCAAAEKRARREAEAREIAAAAERHAQRDTEERARSEVAERASEVIPYLRKLGIRPDDARRAAEHGASIPDVPFAERVRAAIAYYGSTIRPIARTIRPQTAQPPDGTGQAVQGP